LPVFGLILQVEQAEGTFRQDAGARRFGPGRGTAVRPARGLFFQAQQARARCVNIIINNSSDDHVAASLARNKGWRYTEAPADDPRASPLTGQDPTFVGIRNAEG
jgi:hypothetical protein